MTSGNPVASKATVLEQVSMALATGSILALRNFVFGRLEAEPEYVIESEAVDDVLAALTIYLLDEEARGDDRWRDRLQALQLVLVKGEWTAEAAAAALCHREIAALLDKRAAGWIDDRILANAILRLCPLRMNWLQVVDAHQRNRSLW